MELLVKVVVLLPLLMPYTNTDQHISVVLQKCYGSCNQKFCNFSTTCRPLNRTSKLSFTDIYFHRGVKLEAPIDLEIIAYKKFTTVYRQHMIKIKTELCAQLCNADHPIFKYAIGPTNGNALDPCPLAGHRYVKPQVSTYKYLPLVPVGEWRLDFIVSKTINATSERILSWSDFYEVKPTSAIQF